MSPDIRPQLEAAEELTVELKLDEAAEPKEVESKSVHYAATTGLAAGDVESLITSTRERMQRAGWSVITVETLDTSDSPAQKGGRVAATKDTLVAQVAIFDQVGINPAPDGFTWVQIQVANADEDLGWINVP